MNQNLLKAAITLLGLFVFTTASAAPKRVRTMTELPFHLDLEASTQEMLATQKRLQQMGILSVQPADAALERVIAAGKRNLDWLTFMNQHREVPLAFTKPGDLTGIPITAPNRYSGEIVSKNYTDFIATLPEAFRKIVDEGAPFTVNPPVSDEEYVKLGRALDKIYQSGTRWKMMIPYLGFLEGRRANDIRGYYFLNKRPDLERELKNWSTLSQADQAQLGEWLQGQCYNKLQDDNECRDRFRAAVRQSRVWDYYQYFLVTARERYLDFFRLEVTRPDLVWSPSTPQVATLPFKTPELNPIRQFLSVNIEDEWKWTGWQFRLDFQPHADVHVEFQEGVTPHVNGLGGNTIVMDANTPLTEWDVQWTIRHEFGHVLGFPDCYVEYYDSRERVMINYQIDTTNLMCSRAGRMNQGMFDEMKRMYFDPQTH